MKEHPDEFKKFPESLSDGEYGWWMNPVTGMVEKVDEEGNVEEHEPFDDVKRVAWDGENLIDENGEVLD